MKDLREIINEALVERGERSNLTDLAELVLLARELKVEADKAWDEASAARVRGDERTDAAATARAYTLCEILGDQSALAFLGVL